MDEGETFIQALHRRRQEAGYEPTFTQTEVIVVEVLYPSEWARPTELLGELGIVPAGPRSVTHARATRFCRLKVAVTPEDAARLRAWFDEKQTHKPPRQW